MSKELFILFVYDTQLCQREEDDPQDAVLYFYPGWVTDQQRLALCGQLMGATQFYITAFSCPRIISLSSGKFVIQQYGRYLIAVGTDRNVPDWVVDHRAKTLHCLLQLYHQDLDTIYTNADLLGISFKEKLSQIFETYLPILQYAVDVFGTIPTVRLPKSASNVFLEAIQILHCCQEKKGVLGGAVLYQNRVVATQLHADLTKNLVSTDPYRIKSPAENVSTTFHLPVGVQLMKVYIEHKEYKKLSEEAESARASFESAIKRKQAQKRVQNVIGKVPYIPKEATSGMKRDISRIFTVPEEDGETEQLEDRNIPVQHSEAMEDFLNQKSQDAFISSSQCTTPMKDININKVLHERVVSICRVPETEGSVTEKVISHSKAEKVIPDIVKDTIKVQTSTSKSKKTPHFLLNYTDNSLHRCQSMTDITQRAKIAPTVIPLRSYSFGLPRLTRDLLDGDSDKSRGKDLPLGKHFYNTITDPFYPVFRCDGLPISRSLYDQHLAQHYKTLNNEKSDSVSTMSPASKSETLELQLITSSSKTSKAMVISEPEHVSIKTETESIPQDVGQPQETPSKQELYRRSLSLPLKNLTCESNGEDARRKSTTFPALPLESPSVRTRMMGTIPLTPLMAKLSSLAMEEKSNGFYSRDSTPSEFRDFGIPSDTSQVNIPSRTKNPGKSAETVRSESEKRADKTPEKAVLYVFGQQSMALLLLLEEESSSDPELIHSLWEMSVSSLNRLETHLRRCLDHIAQGSETESYSYICLDPRWDMLQRGGPWGCLELDLVGSIHHDFKQANSLTEIVVRCEESTVYGYQCGKTEVFYQQSSNATVGLPTPSDLMGVMPLKARRRLERDHGIVLL